MRRKYRMKKITCFLALTVLVLLTVTGCGGPQEAAEKDKAVSEEKIKAPEDKGPLPLISRKGFDEAFPAPSPDGRYIAYQAREKGGKWDLYLYDIEQDSSMALYSSGGNDQFPVYSPDGAAIVFTSDKEGMEYEDGHKSRDIFMMEGSGINPRKITTSDSDNWFPSFSADGSQLTFASNKNDSEQNFYDEKCAVFSYSLTTGETRELLLNIEYKNGPALSPDGKKLVYMDGDNKLIITSLVTKEEGRLLSEENSFAGGAVFRDENRVLYHNFSAGKFEIREYNLQSDSSRTVFGKLKNCRAPRVLNGNLYFHSDDKGDYDIYRLTIKEQAKN